MTTTSEPGSALAWRASGVLAALLLLLLVWQDVATRGTAVASVRALVAETGLARRNPNLARRARREPDPYWGRLMVARALVAEAVEPSSFASLPAREAALEAGRVGERLTLARSLAAAAAAERPVVWQAPMLVGAAIYLAASRAGSPALIAAPAVWRAPLERAEALAPGSAEPARFLAAADLEIWRLLSPPEQQAARRVITNAFADPATFARLAGPWLEVAESRDIAFRLIPDRSQSWRAVEQWAAQRRDWETYCAAAARDDAALPNDAAELLAEARARVGGGDPAGARSVVLSLLALTPPDRALTDTISEALELFPPGPATRHSSDIFTPWLTWEMSGFARGVELLPAQVVARLLEGSTDLAEPERALALLAAGRLAEAEAVDRRAEDLNTERWAPYGLAKARVLAARGETEGARASLALVHPAWREIPAAARLAAALGMQGTQPPPDESWAGTSWRWRRGTAWLDVMPAAPATALAITIARAPSDGAVAEVAVGFSRVWRGAVQAGETVTAPIADPIMSAPLVITMRTVAGGRVTPGDVHLVESSR